MASLTGKFIKDTYQSLLKIIDNGNATSTQKEITDGEGNSIGVSVDTSGNVTAIGTIQGATITDGTTSISDLQTNKQDVSEKGASNGYAPLDSNSKIPTSNLPDSVLGQVEYKGTWNANIDTPTLPSASGVKGNYYVVSVAGVYESVDYEVGDWIISNGTSWEKVDNSDKVSSVNGATGAVVLDTDDISEGSTNQYYTSTRANADFDTRLATKDTDDLAEGTNLYYTDARVASNSAVAANTAKVGITEQQADAIVANTAKNSYPSADATKLLGIEAGANVTDVDNVTTALNSISIKELEDVADTTPTNNQVLRYNSTSGEYEPTTLDLTGLVDSVNGQSGDVVLDTDDISEGTTNLYYTEARVSANTDVAANTAKVGITTQQASDITANNAKISFDSTSSTKLAGIEENADVTDTENVTAAGALMDSEVDSDIKTLSLPANTTISTFGASLIDDADAGAARTTLGVDPAGTDNSTDVTLAGASDYITISGQTITRNKIDLTADVTGVLPVANMSATALTTVQTASSESAQLALTTQEGDVVVRTDENKTYMRNSGTSGTMSDFTLLATPTDAVTSVNGNTGAVTVQENVTTNLSVTANGTSLTVNSSDGTDASIPAATTSAWGAMTDEDKTKLNGIATGAEVNVQSDWNATSGDALILNKPTTITAQQASDITANNAKISFDSASSTKLAGIESGAEVNPTASEIKTSYESNSNTNAFTDAEKTKLSGIASGAEVNVNADWNATSGDAVILNKPTTITAAQATAISNNTSGVSTNASNISTNATNIDGKVSKSGDTMSLSSGDNLDINALSNGDIDFKNASTTSTAPFITGKSASGFSIATAVPNTLTSPDMILATFESDGTDFATTNTKAFSFYRASNEIMSLKRNGDLDVTGNISVSGTVDGRDVATDGSKLDGIESGATADQTAAEILTAIKTVDGSGSGLDADTVDGIQGSEIWRKGSDIGSGQDLNNYTTDGYYHQNTNANASSGSNYPESLAGMLEVLSDGAMVYQRYTIYNSTHNVYVRTYYNGTWYNWNKLWNNRNDGSGSGLDADTLDTLQASQFLRSDTSDTMSGTLTVNGNVTASGTRTIRAQYDSNHYMQLESNSAGGVLKGLDGGVTTTLVRSYGDSYFNGGNFGIGTANPQAKLDVDGGVRIADDAAAASSTNVGTLRYRTSGNNSYVDMCMQTGATTYAWINIVQNNW